MLKTPHPWPWHLTSQTKSRLMAERRFNSREAFGDRASYWCHCQQQAISHRHRLQWNESVVTASTGQSADAATGHTDHGQCGHSCRWPETYPTQLPSRWAAAARNIRCQCRPRRRTNRAAPGRLITSHPVPVSVGKSATAVDKLAKRSDNDRRRHW